MLAVVDEFLPQGELRALAKFRRHGGSLSTQEKH
jgi:hypothetical protein